MTESGSRIKVLIADNNEYIIEGLCNKLQNNGSNVIPVSVSDPEELERKYSKTIPDICIVDLHFEMMSVVEKINQNLHEKSIKILFMTDTVEDFDIKETVTACGMGLISKSSPLFEFNIAVRKILSGRFYFDTKIDEDIVKLIKSVRSKEADLNNKLTYCEIRILRSIASGKTQDQTCHELSISRSTFETHRKHIMTKKEIENTPALYHYAFKYFLKKY